MSRKIIFSSDHLTVVHADAGTDTVFVTFNEMGLHAKGDEYWGGTLLERYGVSAIGFVSARPNWYPIVDMMRAIDVANIHIGGRRVITYGFSQGGYGAIKFGKCLGASMALGFSPQWSINPADVAVFGGNYTSFYDPVLRNGERVEKDDICERNFIFFDPLYKEDSAQFTRLAALGSSVSIPVPFTNHRTVRVISEGGIARQFIQLCLTRSDISAAEFRALLRQGRRRSMTYAEGKVAKLEKTLTRHGRFFTATVAALPEGSKRDIAIVRLKVARQMFDEAAVLLAAIPDADLLAADLITLWGPFRSSGFRYGEARLAPLFARKYPDEVFFRLHGANSYVHLGEVESAARELQTIARIKGAAAHAANLITLLRMIERFDVIEEFTDRVARDDALNRRERIRIGFELLELYRLRKMRGKMLRELLLMAELCAGDDASMLRLIELGIEAGELTFVEEMLKKAADLETTHPVVRVYAVECLAARDRFLAFEPVRALLKSGPDDYSYWSRLSVLVEKQIDWHAAALASERALAVAPSDKLVASRSRHAHVLVGYGRRREAVKHLKLLLGAPEAAGHFAYGWSFLAVLAGDPGLAEQFLDRWLSVSGADTHVQLSCSKRFMETKNLPRARACIEFVLKSLENGHSMSRESFAQLIENASLLDFQLERACVKQALLQFPNDLSLKQHAATDRGDFAAKFYGAAPAMPEAEPLPKSGIFAKVRSLRRYFGSAA